MRIEQPGHLRGRMFDGFREVLRIDAIPIALWMGIMSGLPLLCVCLDSWRQPVSPWRWLGAAALGPFALGLIGVSARLVANVPRSMELRDGSLILRGCGTSLPAEKIESFTIRPDDTDPTIAWCAVGFRYAPKLRMQGWGMFVDDIPATLAFRREVLKGIPEPRRSAVESGESL